MGEAEALAGERGVVTVRDSGAGSHGMIIHRTGRLVIETVRALDYCGIGMWRADACKVFVGVA